MTEVQLHKQNKKLKKLYVHEQSEIVSNIIFRKIVQKVTKTAKKKIIKVF